MDPKTYFQRHHYARMAELRKAGYHSRDIAEAVQNGWLDKISPGLYRLAELIEYNFTSFVDVCTSRRDAVICLSSALEYYDLSTVNPHRVTIAVPQNTDKVRIIIPPVDVFFFTDSQISWGIRTVQSEQGNFRIFDEEKTICDTFRLRNQIGEDIAIEALKNYMKKTEANLWKLRDYSIRSRIKTIITPFMKAVVG